MLESRNLIIPDAAKADAKSFEILRVWIPNKGLHVSMLLGPMGRSGGLGIMLADLARHVVNAYRQNQGYDEIETLTRIRAGLEAELDAPTDKPSGNVLDG